MREILFRAWDRFSGCYYKGGIRAATFAGKYTFDVRERFVLEQFTGILDKNGKQIFEGDIVVFKSKHIEYIERIEPQKVEWHPEIASFVISDKKGRWTYLCDALHLTVVGNIHDNPELLEEESHEAT